MIEWNWAFFDAGGERLAFHKLHHHVARTNVVERADLG